MAKDQSPVSKPRDAVAAGEADLAPLATTRMAAGYIAPVIGRTAMRDVAGYFGFPLIKKGEKVSAELVTRAQAMGRLYEIIAATEVE